MAKKTTQTETTDPTDLEKQGGNVEQDSEQLEKPEQPDSENGNVQPEDKPEPKSVLYWMVNVKYRSKRYRAGELAEIMPEDRDELIATGVIREEA